MNSDIQNQHTSNHPPLEPYPIKIETKHKVGVNTKSKKASHQPTAKHLANTKN